MFLLFISSFILSHSIHRMNDETLLRYARPPPLIRYALKEELFYFANAL